MQWAGGNVGFETPIKQRFVPKQTWIWAKPFRIDLRPNKIFTHHFSICMVPLLFDRYWCRSKVLGGIFQSTKENFAGVTSIWIWFPSPCFRSGFILFGGFNFSYWRHGLLFMDYGAGLIPWQLIFRRCVSKHNKFFFKTQSVFSAHHDEKFLLYHGLGHSHDFHFPFPSFPVQQLVSHFIYRFLYGETIWKKSP